MPKYSHRASQDNSPTKTLTSKPTICKPQHKPFSVSKALINLEAYQISLYGLNLQKVLENPESVYVPLVLARQLRDNKILLKSAGPSLNLSQRADYEDLSDCDFNTVLAHPAPSLLVEAMIKLNEHGILNTIFFEVITTLDFKNPVDAATILVNVLAESELNEALLLAINNNPKPKEMIAAIMMFIENSVCQSEFFLQAAQNASPVGFAKYTIESIRYAASSAMAASHAQGFFAQQQEKRVHFAFSAETLGPK